MPRVILNGRAVDLESGTSLLTALARVGVHVPHLCHDPRLAPIGACRLCVVDIRGAPRPVAACTAEVADGMVVETHTPRLEAERHTLLRLLAWNHPSVPLGAVTDNPFLEELRAYGLEDELKAAGGPEPIDDSHPYIRVDMSRCIHCYRCERICNDVQGQFTWRVWNRGADTKIRPDSGTTLLESSCVSCGACADTCPSGAIEDKTVVSFGRPERWTRTTCPYCGVGCEMNVGTKGGRIVQIRPVLDAPVSKGHLCVKGRYAYGFVDAADRILAPLVRDGGGLRPVSWEDAIGHVAERLRRIRDTYGPGAIGVLGSARATNEENYLAQKFARVVLGTNNVDCCARVCHSPSAAALTAMLGAGAATNSFDDIELARTLLVFGSNATENHPIVGARIRQAALRGARLIVVDPRRIELAALADVHLRPRAGTDVLLLNAIAFTIVDEGLLDDEFVASRVDGLEAFRAFIAEFDPERVAALCGVDAESIRRAARIYAAEKPAMCFHGLGLTEHARGTETVMCLINLGLLTGNIGAPGTGMNPLRGQNNVQGAAHMGCQPGHITGAVSIDKGRRFFERAWNAAIPVTCGLDLMEMIDAAGAGRLKALYAIGYDVLLTNPNANSTREALSRLDLLIVQDMFLSETARESATVVLPAASSFEKDGTFMNSERRIQRVRRVFDPPRDARTDSDILCAIARAMGAAQGFEFQSAEEIWDEIRAVWSAAAGITYRRLDGGGLQWPCPTESHPGTRVLHEREFAGGSRASLRRIEHRPQLERCSEEFPLVLVTGRKLYQFNAGTMTGRTLNTTLQPADVLDVSPEDARRYGLSRGERVVIRSRYGQADIAVNIDDRQRTGEVFATFHTCKVFINRLVSPHRDTLTNTPQYKVTAVRIDKVLAP